MAFPYGSTVKPIETKDDGTQFIAFEADQNRAIAKAILHQTLATGEAEHETRAAAAIHQDILGQLVRQIKRIVARMIVRDILTDLTVANFGDDARPLVPRASLGDTNEEDKTGRMTAYTGWKRAGLLLPSQYPDVYAEVGAPPASPEDLALVAERWQSTAALPDGTTNVSVAAQAEPDGSPPQEAPQSGGQSPPAKEQP
jgi:phage gp29-like protein